MHAPENSKKSLSCCWGFQFFFADHWMTHSNMQHLFGKKWVALTNWHSYFGILTISISEYPEFWTRSAHIFFHSPTEKSWFLSRACRVSCSENPAKLANLSVCSHGLAKPGSSPLHSRVLSCGRRKMVKMSSEMQHAQKLTWMIFFPKCTFQRLYAHSQGCTCIFLGVSQSHYPFTVKINKDPYYVACGLHTKVLKENKP